MPLFNREAEKLRKQNLKSLEDRRLAFARKLAETGFRPETMLFCSTESGTFVALARFGGRFAVVTAPVLGQEGDFSIKYFDELRYEREEIYIKGDGLNGAFGFGTKGARGFNLRIELAEDQQALLQVIAGRTSWMEVTLKDNPLLRTRRSRGDANLCWDLKPVDYGDLSRIEEILEARYLN